MPWRESAAELDRARAERPVVVEGPDGRLFGILTPPAPSAPPAGLCVVFFTLPRSHRNRMWVEGARRLAARGFSCFRFDYHGVGDSEGESVRVDPSRPYQGDALAVLRHLRAEHGLERFVLYGSCFDARTALSAFEGEAAAIDSILFMAAPVMDEENVVRADADRKDWRHLVRALGRAENWRSLGTPGRWRHMGAVIGRIARRGVNGAAPTPALPLSPGFVRHFDALVRSGAEAQFFYGREDREYQSFQHAERGLWPRLSPESRARITLELWDGHVHDGTLDIPTQRRIVEHVLAWLGSRHPARSRTVTADRIPA